MRTNMSAALRRAAGALLAAVALGAQAMEDESIYSYTLVEAGAGKVRGQSGSAQSLAVDGWVGGDFNRLWYQLDTERRGGRIEAAELQLLYGRYIAPFWDAQIGLRRDERPDRRNYLALGVRGLAPYAFDVDLKLFVRDDGKVFARTRFENEFLITNRFIVTPSLGVEWSASDIDATVRRGAYQADVGVQARYEFNRRVAPYLGLSRTFYPRAQSGGEATATQWRAGLRVLF
ncbi:MULTISPECIES: copper resistance protein B [unclassified Methylibium]|uniref:copper resistance protein B n=1 Tax=unclassified Methylibium TaxID=2633235 RepID=UPI0003F419B9|nr:MULTISPECIES: copper resistance protein B [unclassified Methylibium]EWS57033.1 Copper resistance protein B precursor [Methylibium sp. T29]EWS62232.1 Copper resistance protein B precursor [Methylibium sp. T29-B]